MGSYLRTFIPSHEVMEPDNMEPGIGYNGNGVGSSNQQFGMLLDELEPNSMSQAATEWPVARVATTVGTGSGAGGKRNKIFQCAVHECMRFDPLSLAVIDTKEFQRLRELKQLGLTNYVYSSAVHTRFDHSLGVGHLANKWAEHLYSMQRSELQMDQADIACVTLAGLCHDLGHGPFSHVFDRELLARKGITGWEHEEMSCMIFDEIVATLPERADGTTELSEDDVKRIKRMINIEKASASDLAEKRFLYDIVANKRNGIDVDKFDYLARDSYHCGVKLSFDHKRTMAFSRVLDGQICFKSSLYDDLFELFHSRQRMHRKVYTHRKAKSVEFMVVDALLEADPVFRLTEKLWNPKEFIRLDDSLLRVIESWADMMVDNMDEDRVGSLRKAQNIIQRLRKRDLYRYVNEVKIPRVAHAPAEGASAVAARYKDEVARIKREAVPENLVEFSRGTGVVLNPDDVIFSVVAIDYTAENRNPLDRVQFFDQADDTTSRTINQNDVSHMFMEVFQEHTLRLYSRNSSPAIVEAMQVAFEQWRKRYLPTQHLITPRKAKAVRLASEAGDREDNKRARSLMSELDQADDA